MKPLRLVAPRLPRALCASYSPDVWFPDTHKPSEAKRAKDICNGERPNTIVCPERERCLAWALAMDEQAGVWGGLSERERASLREKAS